MQKQLKLCKLASNGRNTREGEEDVKDGNFRLEFLLNLTELIFNEFYGGG